MTTHISSGAAAARESARAGDGKFGVQPVSETVGVDLTESAPVPSLTATVQPQEWDGDDAIDSGPEVAFEVGDILAEMGEEERSRYADEIGRPGRDLDELYFEAVRRGRVPDGYGPFYVSVDEDDFDDWDAQRTATHLGVEDFDEVVDFLFENEPDDTGANAAIDDELVEPHVLLHHLTRGDRVGSYKSDGDEYLVTTLVPGSGSVPEVEKAQVVSEAGATAAFNNEIDEFERKQRR